MRLAERYAMLAATPRIATNFTVMLVSPGFTCAKWYSTFNSAVDWSSCAVIMELSDCNVAMVRHAAVGLSAAV